MSEPRVRAVGPLAARANSKTLTVTMPARVDGDVVLLFQRGFCPDAAIGNVDAPGPPTGWNVLLSHGDLFGFECLWWAHAGSATPAFLKLGHTFANHWQAFAISVSGANFQDQGWLESPGGVGNYYQFNKADYSAMASYNVMTRVSFDTLGVTNRIAGWGSADMTLSLNASNRLILKLTNTVGGAIGNTQSTASIPGLTVGRKVWLWALVDSSSGILDYLYSFDDVENWEAVHWTFLDSALAGSGAGTTIRVSNSETLYQLTDLPANAAMDGNIYSFSEFNEFGTLLSLNYTNTYGGLVVNGSVFAVRPDTQNSSPIEWFDWTGGQVPYPVNDVYTLPFSTFGTDRLVIQGFFGEKLSSDPIAVGITGPDPPWRSWTDRSWSTTGYGSKQVLRTRNADADDTAEAVTAEVKYTWYGWQVVLRGFETPDAPPAIPQPDILVLGCATSYSAWITDVTYSTTLDRFQWTALSWERVLDDVSKAQVTIPDEYGGTRCLTRLAGQVEPWRHGLLIERNDQSVWRGPITLVRREDKAVVIQATDILGRMQKRFSIRNNPIGYTEIDAGRIFRDVIVVHARLTSDPWDLACPLVTVNVPVTRSLRPSDGKMAWDLLAEILDSAVDAYILDGTLIVWEPNAGWRYQNVIKRTLDGPYNTNYEFVYGLFTNESFAARPNWSLDGAGQANFVLSATTDVGEEGFRQLSVAQNVANQVEVGVLDLLDPNPLQVPEDQEPVETAKALKARAESLVALRAEVPLTIEESSLTAHAPISVEHLRPGSLWRMDLFDDGYGELLTVARLKKASVSVRVGTGGSIEEDVRVTLQPPGWSGDLGDL